MNNAQNNESQDKQSERAADSPLKKPETETAHARPSDVAKAASGQEVGLGGGGGRREESLEHTGPLGETNLTHRAMDVLNDDTLDDTVDADGKSRDAAADTELIERNPDAFIGVDATLVNFVGEQGDGLGGFDSRPGRNGLLLRLEGGYSMLDRGMVAPSVAAIENERDYQTRDAHGNTLRGRRHYAVNHGQPSRLIEIQKRDK
jgi:Protein of unknown function (DUF3005)